VKPDEFEILARRMCDQPTLISKFKHHDDGTVEWQLMKAYKLGITQIVTPEFFHESIAKMHVENAIAELNNRTTQLEEFLENLT
jgi:hypothetical protein